MGSHLYKKAPQRPVDTSGQFGIGTLNSRCDDSEPGTQDSLTWNLGTFIVTRNSELGARNSKFPVGVFGRARGAGSEFAPSHSGSEFVASPGARSELALRVGVYSDRLGVPPLCLD